MFARIQSIDHYCTYHHRKKVKLNAYLPTLYFSTPPYIFQFNNIVFDYEFNKICDILASLYTPTKKT